MVDDKIDAVRGLYARAAERCSGKHVAQVFMGAGSYLNVRAREREVLQRHATRLTNDAKRWLENSKNPDDPSAPSPLLDSCLREAIDAYQEMVIYRTDWAEEYYEILRIGLAHRLDAVDALAGIAGMGGIDTEE